MTGVVQAFEMLLSSTVASVLITSYMKWNFNRVSYQHSQQYNQKVLWKYSTLAFLYEIQNFRKFQATFLYSSQQSVQKREPGPVLHHSELSYCLHCQWPMWALVPAQAALLFIQPPANAHMKMSLLNPFILAQPQLLQPFGGVNQKVEDLPPTSLFVCLFLYISTIQINK